MAARQFGTFDGVFIPSFQGLIGAVIFLLLPNLVSTLGLLPMIGVILLAHVVSFSTAFSINDCAASVGRVGAGGMYSLIKTSLNTAFGGSIGLQLYVGQAIGIGFYSTGFALSVLSIASNFGWYATYMKVLGWDILTQQQVIATIIILIGFLFAMIGANFTSKIQLGIFVVLVLSITIVLSSALFQPTYGGEPIFGSVPYLHNPDSPVNFWVGLTIFFPAVTGFVAGVGMSGLLKNPRRSLGIGLFSAIIVTMLIYLGVSVVSAFVRPELLAFDASASSPRYLTHLFRSNPFLYMVLLSGIITATSSSAIAFFISAPLTLQAIVHDRILPRAFDFLGRDFFPKGREPRYAILLTLVISLLTVWSGNLAFIARLVGITYLTIYGWINFAAFMERISSNPSFRPNRFGHWILNLIGFLMSLFLISMDNVVLGLLIILLQPILLWALSQNTQAVSFEGVWWGFFFRIMSWSLQKVQKITQGTKNWRPVLAVFARDDDPNSAEAVIEMGKFIGHNMGIVNYFLIGPEDHISSSDTAGDVFHLRSSVKPSALVSAVAQTGLAKGLEYNSVLLPFDQRFEVMDLIERLIERGKNILLLKNASRGTSLSPRIDIWWRGFENGNLMAILAHMMTRSEQSPFQRIRVFRTLYEGQGEAQARQELEELLYLARIDGEVCLLHSEAKGFVDNLRQHSGDSGLIMLGMPGKPTGTIKRLFKLDRLFFDNDIRKYSDLPPILFVKSAGTFSLLDQ